MAEIVIKDLKKQFGDFIAVTNSNLTINDGDFFVLLGPSGCGKTTTLRMIAGLEFPSHGKIFLDAEDITFLRASQRNIAFVFQMFALYPHMNVEKNIGFPLKTQGKSRSEIRNRVHEVAKLLHLDNVLKSKVSALSGGDKQRVALGRAIIRRPKAFLMDEPLGSLDAEFRELMSYELKKMHNDINATTVYVTHDQNEAMAMGDRIGIMDKGVMLQADDPLTIYNKPRAKFVGSFIGSPAMNFIDVNAFVKKGSTSVKINGSQLIIPECYEDTHIDFNFLGIRPENIRVADEGNIKGAVYGVEYLGANKIITVDTEFGRIKARTPSVINAKIGDNVGLEFDPNSIIIFNGDDETAIKSQFMN